MARVLLWVWCVALLGSGVLATPGLAQMTPEQTIAKATEMCREGKGQAIGCAQLGLMYFEGDGVAQDAPQGLRYLEMACRLKNTDSCEIAGTFYLMDASARDLPKAQSLFDRSCKLNSLDGCYRAAIAYFYADEMTKGVDSALRSCGGIKDVKERHPKGCDLLGRAYRDGSGVKADPAKAHQYFKQACNNSFGAKEPSYESCVWAGDAEEEGKGAKQDYLAARNSYRVACMFRVPSGCNNLGRMMAAGRGLAANVDEAARNYDRACRFGSKAGCANLDALRQGGHASYVFAEIEKRRQAEKAIPADLPDGTRYMLVLDALDRKNYDVALPILDMMIGDSNPDAMYRKAVMFYTGEGVAQDYKQALRLLEQAGRLDHPYANYMAGHMYLDGQGTTVNLSWAEALFLRATELGVAEAGPIHQQLRANRQAFFAERQASLVAQEQANREARYGWRGTALESAWKNYFDRQKAQAGNTVCAMIYQGGRMSKECMSEDHFNKYYKP